MFLLAHETISDVQASADQLKALGPSARKLMAECVAEQGVSRAKLSKSAHALVDAGFLFTRESILIGTVTYHLTPTLLGEEALELLDNSVN